MAFGRRIDLHIGTFYDSDFDQLYGELVQALMEEPQFICSPRGQLIREGLAVTLILENPRARLLSYRARDPQYGFGVGEFLWYWTGKRDLETMLYYNKRAAQFSDDGKTVNSAYGYRIRSIGMPYNHPDLTCLEITQWEACKKALRDDPDSRRALLIINVPYDQAEAVARGSKDVPCTLSLQFFIREKKLDLHVHMRSNDAVWGLTYDLFSFTLLQEMMMLELRAAGMDVDLGAYYHTAGSLHIYERHFEMANQIIQQYREGIVPAQPMPPLDLGEMASLVEYERLLRIGEYKRLAEKEEYDGSSRFSGGVRWMAEQLEAHRRKRDAERGGAVGSRDGGGAAGR